MIGSLSMTAPRLPLTLILWAAVAWSQGVDSIVRRIQELAAQEPVALGIESELRAASLLREAHPNLSAAFMKSGKMRLAAHPEVQATKWIVSSLLTLDP